MHPFMNSHFHFLITVESATSQVLLQWPRQITVQQGNRVDGPQVTSEMTVTAPMFDMCCVQLHRHAEGSHLMTDVQVSNSLTLMLVYQSECSHWWLFFVRGSLYFGSNYFL